MVNPGLRRMQLPLGTMAEIFYFGICISYGLYTSHGYVRSVGSKQSSDD